MSKLAKKESVQLEKIMPKEYWKCMQQERQKCKTCKETIGSSQSFGSLCSKFHKNEYIYKGSQCRKGFMTSQEHNHMVAHAETRRIKCSKGCPKTFGSEGALKKHLLDKQTKKQKPGRSPSEITARRNLRP